MKINSKVKDYIDKSVLCWLATSNAENQPSVSPKEIFSAYLDNSLIIANIASPNSIKNIRVNNQVCVSFIDVLVQKGFKIYGKAEIINKNHIEFNQMKGILIEMTQGKFPFSLIIKISAELVEEIIAPKYILFPETTEEQQILSAKNSYEL